MTRNILNVNIFLVDSDRSFLERWSSWFKAPVLKIGVRASVPWVRIPPSPPKIWRHTQAGRRGQFAKLLGFVRAARVRISLSPPLKTTLGCLFFVLFFESQRGRSLFWNEVCKRERLSPGTTLFVKKENFMKTLDKASF